MTSIIQPVPITEPINEKTAQLLDMMREAGFKSATIGADGIHFKFGRAIRITDSAQGILSDILYSIDKGGGLIMALKCARFYPHVKSRTDHGLTHGHYDLTA
jgi:hypothetical protein